MAEMTEPREHPMQRVIWSQDGTPCFQSNPIVECLWQKLDMTLDELEGFCPDDMAQFAQLIGCSVFEYSTASYVTKRSADAAELAAAKLVEARA